MRKYFLLFITSILLFWSITSVSAATDTTSPEDSAEKPLRENLTTIVESEDYLEYTYIENGIQYKVEEVIESDDKGTNIVSTFYEKNKNNQYVESKKQFTNLSIENNVIEVLISKEGRTIDKTEVELVKDTSLESDPYNIEIPGGGSKWTYQGTRKYTNYIGNLTKAGIISTLIAAVPGITSKIAGLLAGIVYSHSVDDIWFTEENYLYIIPDRISPQGKKTKTWMYMDADRTTLIPDQNFPIVEEILY